MEHPIGELMQTAMASIKDMVDVNTVIGKPVQAGADTTVIPISRVSFGYVTAGGDLASQERGAFPSPAADFPFAGGSGAGVSVQPVGFLVVSGDSVRMLPATCHSVVDRMVEMIPTVMEDVRQLVARPEGSAAASPRM
ncbi:MAG: GerW family sporulation protein [Clostridia bacterium]|nr:GerW family sporulation protein [Clostridia bacterium]